MADFNANVNVDGILTATANATFSGALVQFNNDVVIGSNTSDSVSVNAYLATDLLPLNTTVDLGSSTQRFGNVHSTSAYTSGDMEASGEFRLKGASAKTLRVSDTAYQDLKFVFDNGSTPNTAIVANTSGLFGGVSQLYTLGSPSVNWKSAYIRDFFVTGDETVTGNTAINGGGLTTTNTPFSLINTTATTVNAFGAATTLNIGGATGAQTLTLGGASTANSTYNFASGATTTGNTKSINLGTSGVSGSTTNINIGSSNGGTISLLSPIVVGPATANLWNTSTTVNAFGAATVLNLGAATGNTNILNNAVVTGDVAVNGGDVTTSATTFNLLNTTATTVNAFGAATAISIGASTGTLTLNNPAVVGGASANLWNTSTTTVNAFGAATAVTIGATTGTATIRNASLALTGGNVTTSSTTASVFDTTATTVNAFGAATSATIGATTGTLNLRNPIITGASAVTLWNTGTTSVSAFGAATSIVMGAADSVFTLGKNTGNTSVILNGQGSVTVDTNITTGQVKLFPTVSSGTMLVGSSNGGKVDVLFNTDSTALGTGSLITRGGASVQKTLRVGTDAYVGGNLVVAGQVTFTGNVSVTLSESNTANLMVTDTASFAGTVNTSIIPSSTNAYDLGSTFARWNGLYANTVDADIIAVDDFTATNATANTLTIKTGSKDFITFDVNRAGTSGSKITIQTPSIALAANSTLTLANGNTVLQVGTMAKTEGKLNQFANTTSAELRGIVSDTTGTGILVFGTSPSFTSSIDSGATFAAFGSATDLTVGYSGAATSVTKYSTGAVASGSTKTVNLATGGTAGSTTAVNIGSTLGTSNTTINGTLTVTGNLSANGVPIFPRDTNLGASANATVIALTSSTGTGATITAANAISAGVITAGSQTIGGDKTFANTAEFKSGLTMKSDFSSASWGTQGIALAVTAVTATDTSSAANSVIDKRRFMSINTPTFNANASNVNITMASTLYVTPPAASANTVLANRFAIETPGRIYISTGSTYTDPCVALRDYNTGVFASDSDVIGMSILGNRIFTANTAYTTFQSNVTFSSGVIHSVGSLYPEQIPIWFGAVNRSGMNHNGNNFIITNSVGNTYINMSSVGGSVVVRDTTANTAVIKFTMDIASGDFTAAGNVTAHSDRRLKDNIITIPDALAKVNAIRGVNYTKDGVPGTGVIAQEVLEVIPEVVNTKGEYMSVAYGNLVGVLIEAVKELTAEVSTLKGEIETLKNR